MNEDEIWEQIKKAPSTSQDALWEKLEGDWHTECYAEGYYDK